MNSEIKAYYNHKTDYGANKLRQRKINSLVEKEINLGNQYILDVGCAGGYITANWKNKGNTVIGLDISEKSVLDAKHVLDKVYLTDLESNNWPAEIIHKQFDIILCAEILEHLFNPINFLLKLKNLLKSSGYIIITTPNFLVWNNRLRMLFGEYGDKEIFYDPGHIRLFSYSSLLKLLCQVGLKIITEDNIWYPNKLEKFAKILPANLFVYQTIIKASFNQ